MSQVVSGMLEAKSRLIALLEYIDQVEKLKRRAAFVGFQTSSSLPIRPTCGRWCVASSMPGQTRKRRIVQPLAIEGISVSRVILAERASS